MIDMVDTDFRRYAIIIKDNSGNSHVGCYTESRNFAQRAANLGFQVMVKAGEVPLRPAVIEEKPAVVTTLAARVG